MRRLQIRPGARARTIFTGLGLAALTALTACADAPAQPPEQVSRALPATRWDHHPQAAAWTRATLSAATGAASELVETVPADIETFCPGYAEAGARDRGAFWAGLFSGLARFESTWNPRAAGGGGRYRGLLQISPATARYRGCSIDSGDDLYDGATNLGCGARIAAAAVARDGVVAGHPGHWGGVAADWPPLRDPAKRSEIAAFTRTQPYCTG